eukprot:TRINITY_DN9594_c0_g2_i1.p1 TRINITY_DN9594_c0_g2~~TRINITY_DN9594_c0_g2_i1.p1  ORF type:complete len:447 (+),score=100.39 TRINITY_DN9594_c0_g2_i1:78-1343(+)
MSEELKALLREEIKQLEKDQTVNEKKLREIQARERNEQGRTKKRSWNDTSRFDHSDENSNQIDNNDELEPVKKKPRSSLTSEVTLPSSEVKSEVKRETSDQDHNKVTRSRTGERNSEGSSRRESRRDDDENDERPSSRRFSDRDNKDHRDSNDRDNRDSRDYRDRRDNWDNRDYRDRRDSNDGNEHYDRDSERRRTSNDQDSRLSSSVVTATVKGNRIEAVTEAPDVRERNRKIFGHLVGTLKSSVQDFFKSQQSSTWQKRKEVEKKIDERVVKTSQQLQEEHRRKLEKEKEEELARREEIRKKLEEKELELLQIAWDDHYKQLSNFIRTKATPHIYWTTQKKDTIIEQLLQKSNAVLQKELQDKKSQVSSAPPSATNSSTGAEKPLSVSNTSNGDTNNKPDAMIDENDKHEGKNSGRKEN